ncbi:MAG: HRDC domain-containing protein [Chitinophagaceae bacterium]|nr:HRDC domain-containing protein [Chitinophagaceae bacterium]
MDKTLIQNIISDYEASVTKIILFCLTELPFFLGAKRTISVLRGTKSTFAIEYHLNKLHTFSVLSSFSSNQLSKIIEILATAGLIKYENASADFENMPVLKITDNGKVYLEGKCPTHITIMDVIIDNEIPEMNELEKNLFLELKGLRRDIALKHELPPYVVCNDQTLREICFEKPTNTQLLISIKGVGDKFVEKHGVLFLEVINKHVGQQPING